jgi:hypothetical protein
VKEHPGRRVAEGALLRRSPMRVRFAILRRAALIGGLELRGNGEAQGAWWGPLAEASCATRLRHLRLEPGQGWTRQLRFRVFLEDGTQATVRTNWNPTESPNVRNLVAQGLAAAVQSTLPVAAVVEAHRILELVEGRSLPCLFSGSTPPYLRAALDNRLDGAVRLAACRSCGLQVGHSLFNGCCVHRHFLDDGKLCPASPVAAKPASSLGARAHQENSGGVSGSGKAATPRESWVPRPRFPQPWRSPGFTHLGGSIRPKGHMPWFCQPAHRPLPVLRIMAPGPGGE